MATFKKREPDSKAPGERNQPLLWEQVQAAQKDTSHIAIQILDKRTDALHEALRIGASAGAEAREKALVPEFVDFATELEGKSFALKPMDLISIWSRATEEFQGFEGRYVRYKLASVLASVYCTEPIQSEEWKQLYAKMGKNPLYLIELSRVDVQNASIFNEREQHIRTSLDTLRSNRAILPAELAMEIEENWGNGLYLFMR